MTAKQLSVDIDLLQTNPWNSNHVSPDNEAKLQESVRQFGFFKPLVVREIALDKLEGIIGEPRYEILGGEHRWLAAKEVGLKKVPIFNLGTIDDVLAKKITLADNARYGQDDTIELAKLLEQIGDNDGLQTILPYTDADFSSIFSSVNIALDELDLPDGFEEDEGKETEDVAAPKAPKTHAMMRFKVPVADAEKITDLIARIKKRQGFTDSDDLTNAGDALVHHLFNAAED